MKAENKEIQKYIDQMKNQQLQNKNKKNYDFSSFVIQKTQIKNFISQMKEIFSLYKDKALWMGYSQILKENKKIESELNIQQKPQIIRYFFQLSHHFTQKSLAVQIMSNIIAKTISGSISSAKVSQLELYLQSKSKQLSKQYEILLQNFIKWLKNDRKPQQQKSYISSTNTSQTSISWKTKNKSDYNQNNENYEQTLQKSFNKLGYLKRFESADKAQQSFQYLNFKKDNKNTFNNKSNQEQRKRQQLSQMIVNLQKKRQEMQREYTQKENQLFQLTIKFQLLQQQLNRQKQINRQKNQKISQLDSHLSLFNEKSIELTKLDIKYNDLSKQFEKQISNRQEKQIKIIQITQSLQTSQEKFSQQLKNIQILQKKIQDYQKDIKKEKQDNQKLIQTNTYLTKEIEVQKQKIKELQKVIEELNSQKDIDKLNFQKQKEQFQAKIQQLKVAQNTYKEEIDKKLNELQQLNSALNIQKQEKHDKLNALKLQINNLESSSLEQRIKYLLQSSDILTFSNISQKRFLIDTLQDLYGSINRFKLIFRYNKDIKENVHQYIDNKPNFVALIQLANGVIIGGYSHQPLKKGQKSYDGIIFSITDLQIYPLKTKYVLTYDEYFLIFGNSQIRIRIFEDVLFSNFGIMNAHFDNKGKKVEDFIKYQKQREIVIKKFEIYQVDYII